MKFHSCLALIFLSGGPLLAQSDLEWIASYGAAAGLPDAAIVSAADETGNVYVAITKAGLLVESDVVVVKYSASGVLQWAREFDSGPTSRDVPRDILVAANGDVWVCGY